jgi:serine/threonine protein kinase
MHESQWRKVLSNNQGIWEALHHLCKSCMLHLDLRPTNIFLDNKIAPNIADFCCSSCLEEKQNQAVASKQFGSMLFGSMLSIETGVDSSICYEGIISLLASAMLTSFSCSWCTSPFPPLLLWAVGWGHGVVGCPTEKGSPVGAAKFTKGISFFV